MNEQSPIEWARAKARYAIASQSRSLTYEAYGIAKGLRRAGAITKDEFMELSELLVHDTMNSRRWHKFH